MENLYKAPEAILVDRPITGLNAGYFFVTSLRKMSILYIATLGMYMLYWGYKQWDSQRSLMPKKIMPVWRSIFSIFYMHSLCKRIAEQLQTQQQSTWRYSGVATGYVVLMILTTVISQIVSKNEDLPVWVDILSLLLQLTPLLPLLAIQRRANLASLDPTGESNASLSSHNILFIVLGCVFWGIVLLSLVIIALGGLPPESH